MSFPLSRPRRLRASPAIRALVRETTLDAGDLVLPLFIRPGKGVKKPISSMPGHFQRFVGEGNESPGVLLIPQETRTGEAIDSLLLIWLASEAEEWKNRLDWLPL